MGKALRDEAVVQLPRISNNAGHGGLHLARWVKSFQVVDQFFDVKHCIAAICCSHHVKALILYLFRHLLKRFHAMFGIVRDDLLNRLLNQDPLHHLHSRNAV